MGESTTQGHNTDSGNYPVYLKAASSSWLRVREVEVINAGVSGWVSDQLALRAEQQLAAYRPDIVVLYTGWNDFQSYDPFGPPPNAATSSRRLEWCRPASGSGSVGPAALGGRAWVAPVGRRDEVAAARGAEPPARRRRVPLLPGQPRPHRARVPTAGPGVRIAICTLVGRWPMGRRRIRRARCG